jgi:hypothetical protein
LTHGQPWSSLERWLLELPIPARLTSGTTKNGVPRIVYCQQLWWNITGKRFPLLDLPAELRAIIYQQSLGENIYPHSRFDPSIGVQRMVLGSAHHNHLNPFGDFCQAGARSDLPNYKLLSLNKQTREETLRAGWQGSWKHFTSSHQVIS